MRGYTEAKTYNDTTFYPDSNDYYPYVPTYPQYQYYPTVSYFICPHCNVLINCPMGYTYCPYCGKKLYEDVSKSDKILEKLDEIKKMIEK